MRAVFLYSFSGGEKMTIFLILLYILEANGYIIPVGCYIAVWTLAAIKAICGFITTVLKSTK